VAKEKTGASAKSLKSSLSKGYIIDIFLSLKPDRISFCDRITQGVWKGPDGISNCVFHTTDKKQLDLMIDFDIRDSNIYFIFKI
jgi:hypothetical protein